MSKTFQEMARESALTIIRSYQREEGIEPQDSTAENKAVESILSIVDESSRWREDTMSSRASRLEGKDE